MVVGLANWASQYAPSCRPPGSSEPAGPAWHIIVGLSEPLHRYGSLRDYWDAVANGKFKGHPRPWPTAPIRHSRPGQSE